VLIPIEGKWAEAAMLLSFEFGNSAAVPTILFGEFRCFPQSLQVNVDIVIWQLPAINFTIHYLLSSNHSNLGY
jgi:hypothetical protein